MADMTPRQLSRDEYTVGWICALPLEMAAARAMLDEIHQDLPVFRNDDNAYSLGRIGNHNVVIACLPYGEYGVSSATAVAVQLLASFRSVRFGLMVGIGGGVPSRAADIRLGDIVVSKPTNNHGGVVQYDYGKAVGDGKFERTGTLDRPPPILLSALAKLHAEHEMSGTRIGYFLDEMVSKYPRMRTKYTRTADLRDRLFDTNYRHQQGGSYNDHDECQHCDPSRILTRPQRPDTEPVIHYGLIASGNQVVKDSQVRDWLGEEHRVYCIEMEAAGLMNRFPCLVVRGICDYADSHKNKAWQGYAAAVAGAYAKDLLLVTGHTAESDPSPNLVSLGTKHIEMSPFRQRASLQSPMLKLLNQSSSTSDTLNQSPHSAAQSRPRTLAQSSTFALTRFGAIRSLSFPPSDDRLMSVSDRGGANIMEFSGYAFGGRIRVGGISRMFVSPDALFAIDSNGKLFRMSWPSLSRSYSILHHPWLKETNHPPHRNVHLDHTCAAFSPNGELVASPYGDETVCLWDCDSKKARYTLNKPKYPIKLMEISPHGGFIAAVLFDSTVMVWDYRSGEVKSSSIKVSTPSRISFSPGSGQLLAIWMQDSNLEILNFQTMEILYEVFSTPVFQFSPISDIMAIVSPRTPDSISLSNPFIPEQVYVLDGHDAQINGIEFSTDGSFLGSVSDDKTARIWDIHQRTQVYVLVGHENPLTAIAFSQDGEKVATGDRKGIVKTWACLKP